MHLFGEFVQHLGTSIVGLHFLSTEDFGPYTVVYVRGTPGDEVVRIGFFEVNSEGDLVLHLRFVERVDGELYLEPVRQVWSISVNYPFIQLSNGAVNLITTFYYNDPLDISDTP